MFKFIFLQLNLLQFTIKVWIDSFLPQTDNKFMNNIIVSVYVGFVILFEQKCQSGISLDISRYSNTPFMETTALTSFVNV